MNPEPMSMDMFRIDLTTGETTRELARPGVRETWPTDRAGRAAFHPVMTEGGDYEFSATGEARVLFRGHPQLDPADLAPMEPVSFPARDGLPLHAFLTLPPGVTRDDAQRPPLVLVVHGGPWAHDVWGYDAEVQFLASRGYAVLQVNFRGSTGYGRRHLTAAVGELAGAMHDDLVDFMRTLPEFVRPYMVNAWYRYAGDPEDPARAADLAARSPITMVDRIRTPLLVAQGANDARVVQAESDNIVESLRARGVPVEYLLAEDEGHGFANPENRIRLYRAMERHLAEHLGGDGPA